MKKPSIVALIQRRMDLYYKALLEGKSEEEALRKSRSPMAYEGSRDEILTEG